MITVKRLSNINRGVRQIAGRMPDDASIFVTSRDRSHPISNSDLPSTAPSLCLDKSSGYLHSLTVFRPSRATPDIPGRQHHQCITPPPHTRSPPDPGISPAHAGTMPRTLSRIAPSCISPAVRNRASSRSPPAPLPVSCAWSAMQAPAFRSTTWRAGPCTPS